jgi:5-methylcytosine-specific restriction endonuclease McrA
MSRSVVWWYWYNRYLESNQWKEKAKKVRRRDKYKCRVCGKPGWVVHHLTYKRVGKERLSDLITLCEHCHKDIHSKD